MPELQLHAPVLVLAAGAPVVGTVVGLEFSDVDGTLWAKVARNDGQLWQLTGDAPTEVRSKWMPAHTLTPMGGM